MTIINYFVVNLIVSNEEMNIFRNSELEMSTENEFNDTSNRIKQRGKYLFVFIFGSKCQSVDSKTKSSN